MSERASQAAVSSARAFWRWLTSMRTALILLLVLALAAVPGSIWPQRNVSIENVNGYLREHPSLGPVLDRFWAFDVFASPWFSAVYLLLFLSLVGCLVPRLRQHAANLIAKPPEAPSRLDRLPHSAQRSVPDDPATAVHFGPTRSTSQAAGRLVTSRPAKKTEKTSPAPVALSARDSWMAGSAGETMSTHQ